nr:superoxide dismutase family protein [uncultured Flavobacterium sp.]
MRKVILGILAIGLMILSCKSSSSNDKSKTLNLSFESKSGSNVIGSAVFSEKNGKVTFTAKLSGLKPGVHAIHIHEKSDCSAADATSTGGHWNPTFKKHGKWGDVEYHKGDIGNFTADTNGNGTISMSTEEWCIGCGDETKDILGKGLIVHDKPDDFVTQPTGNAGARVACTALIK